jgi:dihydroneopterin aldolase
MKLRQLSLFLENRPGALRLPCQVLGAAGIDILTMSLADTQPSNDQLDEVVDYDFVRQVVHQRVAQGHIGLQETLCDDIMAALMAHPGVQAAQVSTRKPDVYPDCEAVGVEIFRAKPGVL